MNWTFDNLPLHPLLVHFVAVVVPLAALLAIVSAVWPAARGRLGLAAPIVALVALIAVPVTTHTGEVLERQVQHSTLIEAHTELGDTLLPWALAVFVFSAVQWAWYRYAAAAAVEGSRFAPIPSSPRALIAIVLSVFIVISAIGSLVTVVRIGESGARAVWTGRFDTAE